MSAVSSSFKRKANNPRRFDKPWQLNDRIRKHCKNEARRLVSKLCVQFDARKKIIKLCSASRKTFRAWFLQEQIPKILEDNSEHIRAFWERQTSPKKPRNKFRTEKFQDYFWETNTRWVYSLTAPLLGSAKSIYFVFGNYSKQRLDIWVGLTEIDTNIPQFFESRQNSLFK